MSGRLRDLEPLIEQLNKEMTADAIMEKHASADDAVALHYLYGDMLFVWAQADKVRMLNFLRVVMTSRADKRAVVLMLSTNLDGLRSDIPISRSEAQKALGKSQNADVKKIADDFMATTDKLNALYDGCEGAFDDI